MQTKTYRTIVAIVFFFWVLSGLLVIASMTPSMTPLQNSLVPEVKASPSVSAYYPSAYNLGGGTSLASGTLTNLQANDSVYMTFHSYVSANATGKDYIGYTSTSSSTTSIKGVIAGSNFTTSSTQAGWAINITAYIGCVSSAKNAKCMIYKGSNLALVGTTAQQSVPTHSGGAWYTFSFSPYVWLNASTMYVVTAWMGSTSGTGTLYYTSGATNQGSTDTVTYGTPPNPLVRTKNSNKYSIYCGIIKPSQYTVQVEFTGASNTYSWTQLKYSVVSLFTAASVTTTIQLYNYTLGNYPSGGNGYISYTSSATPNTRESKVQTITVNPTQFRDASGNWKLKITGVLSTNTQFDWSGDFIQYQPILTGYALNCRVKDWDQAENIQGAIVYADNQTKTSDVNGWSNFTAAYGSVQIKVKYYGFWVNGTFTVTMSSVQTINVRCKLYDVTVKVNGQGGQNPYLANANVTVFNASRTSANKIQSGLTDKNGLVAFQNLPNNTLVFTQCGGLQYSVVIGNTTQTVSSNNQLVTLTANQNYVSISSNYGIFAWIPIGTVISLDYTSWERKLLKTKRR